MIMDVQPVGDATRREMIVRNLRNLILSGSVPAGQKLVEQDLAQRLGVSRAPLREAMRELVECGLLISRPYRGIRLRSFTRRDLTELYSMRLELEKFAFRECWNNRSDAALADLRARNEALRRNPARGTDPLKEIRQELALHNWCYELSGHRLLMETWQRMRPNIQLYFSLHIRANDSDPSFVNPHDDYVCLAAGDDLKAMLAHLDRHMQGGLSRTLKLIESGPDADTVQDRQI